MGVGGRDEQSGCGSLISSTCCMHSFSEVVPPLKAGLSTNGDEGGESLRSLVVQIVIRSMTGADRIYAMCPLSCDFRAVKVIIFRK